MFFNNINERLIVAVDFKVDQGDKLSPAYQAREYLEYVCQELAPLEVTIKLNTVLRILGATAVEFVHDQGLHCFLDLKLFDIGNTLENDVAWIKRYEPLMLTVSERVKPTAFKNIQAALPNTLVLPVGPLTDLDDDDFCHFGEKDRDTAVTSFLRRTYILKTRGLICAPTDIKHIMSGLRDSLTIVTPGVQPAFLAKNDNSANALTPAAAIKAGAHALVVGRGITAVPEMSLYDAASRVLEEMHKAFDSL